MTFRIHMEKPKQNAFYRKENVYLRLILKFINVLSGEVAMFFIQRHIIF